MPDNTLGSMLCPYCRKLISVNADSCIHCGRKNPKALTSLPFLQNFLSGRVSFVQGIVGSAIILYVISLLLVPASVFNPRGVMDFLSPSNYALDTLGWTGTYPVIARGRWWSLITAIYLHGNLLHILFNVLWIRQLGPSVEELFGSSRFFIIYTLSGVVGFMASTLFGIQATLGASGAIFGLFGAIVYYGRSRGGSFGAAIYRQTANWAIILFLIGVFFPNVDNFAHGGGFIGGYLAAMLVGYLERSPETLFHRIAAVGLLGLSALAFLLNIFLS